MLSRNLLFHHHGDNERGLESVVKGHDFIVMSQLSHHVNLAQHVLSDAVIACFDNLRSENVAILLVHTFLHRAIRAPLNKVKNSFYEYIYFKNTIPSNLIGLLKTSIIHWFATELSCYTLS